MAGESREYVEVDTTAGRVRGCWRPAGESSLSRAGGRYARSAAFRGIPFAEPPVGELRFAAPVPHRPWSGVRDALEHGATPQRETLSEVTLIPEPSIPGDSTLNVEVFTPVPGDTEAGLPVLVYIHGGGYTAGSPASPWYDGSAFNRDAVVTVSVSYRLGFSGFGWIEDAPHNRAVLDWILALEWVRDNIRSFGGDPARVTIAGQSAGGAAIMSLLGIDRAEPLFAQAYSISGPLAQPTLEQAERTGRALAELAGVAPTVAGWAEVDEMTILELQKKYAEPAPGEDPMTMFLRVLDEGLSWAPMIDGELVTRDVLEGVRRSSKPLVLGATDDEFSMVLEGAKGKLRFVPPSLLLGKMGLKNPARRAYLAANREVRGTAAKVGRFLTDRMFRTSLLRTARAREDRNTWVYRFSWVGTAFSSAVHCIDVPFFFDCLGSERVAALAGENPPQALADAVHGGAVAFIRDGDPGWTRFGTTETARIYALPVREQAHALASVEPLL